MPQMNNTIHALFALSDKAEDDHNPAPSPSLLHSPVESEQPRHASCSLQLLDRQLSVTLHFPPVWVAEQF